MSSEEIKTKPLAEKEYYAIRELFGLISAIQKYGSILKQRAQMKSGVWEKMQRIDADSQDVLQSLLVTIPIEKLRLIQRELPNIRVTVETTPERGYRKKNDEYVYVTAKALDLLIQKTVDFECFACDKTGKAVADCPVRKAIEDTYPFKLPGGSDGQCKFSGILMED